VEKAEHKRFARNLWAEIIDNASNISLPSKYPTEI